MVQGAGWAPGPFWPGLENLVPTGIRFPDLPARRESLRHPGPHLVEKNHWAPNYTVTFTLLLLSTHKAHLYSSQAYIRQPSDLQLTGKVEFLILFSTRTVGEVQKGNAAKWDTHHPQHPIELYHWTACWTHSTVTQALFFKNASSSSFRAFLQFLYTYLRDGNCTVQRYFILSNQQYFLCKLNTNLFHIQKGSSIRLFSSL